VIPLQTAPEKPGFGSPCNGCGFCCAAEVCKLGLHVYGEEQQAPCPAMEFEDGRFWCGVMRSAEKLLPPSEFNFLKLSMGVGIGCDSD